VLHLREQGQAWAGKTLALPAAAAALGEVSGWERWRAPASPSLLAASPTLDGLDASCRPRQHRL